MSHKNFRAIYTNHDENFFGEPKFDVTKKYNKQFNVNPS
jgi:hypothetical protein